MKVLITTPNFPPFNSGLGNAVKEQATTLSCLGYDVVVATSGKTRSMWEDHYSGFRIEKFKVSGSGSLINPLRGDVLSYRKFLVESNFDMVLMNAWQTWSTDICFKYLKDIPGKKVLYSHCLSTNIFFFEKPLKSLARYLLYRPYFFRIKSLLKKLDALIALAPDGCDSRFEDVRIATSLDIPIYVVPNMLSDDAVQCLNSSMPGIGCRKQIISVGAYIWQKGHDFVLRVYAMSSAKNIIPLKIFGQNFTSYTGKLKILAAKLGIQDHFLYFYEGVSGKDLLEEYKKSLAFVCGSRTECQPLVILDAMATGTPFVSRSTGCIDSLAGGYAVASEKLAVASLNRLLEDKMEWCNQSADGVASVQACHQPEIVGEKLASVLNNICNGS
jgi:1,2-diacylglycerol 3-alpha-glucosyltransferase